MDIKHEDFLEAAKAGARMALIELGLDDDNARADLRELREWIQSYRSVKSNMLSTTANVFTMAFWSVLLGGVVWFFKDKIP